MLSPSGNAGVTPGATGKPGRVWPTDLAAQPSGRSLAAVWVRLKQGDPWIGATEWRCSSQATLVAAGWRDGSFFGGVLG